MKLLTKGNPKLEKGRMAGFMSYGVHLSPYKISGKNLCTSASKGCAAACLNMAGRGRMNPTQTSRLNKTIFFNERPKEFMGQLIKEIRNAVKTSYKNNLVPCFRLNLTSDVRWEKIAVNDEGQNIFEMFPDVQFYDYTKHFNRAMDHANGLLPENYHLTFSRSESNQKHVEAVIRESDKVNVAVVFDKLPDTWMGRTVINGDEDDLRFKDPKGVIVGLVPKGPDAKKDESGFMVRV